MAPHSSTLAWNIPWTEEPGRLQSTGVTKSGAWLSDFTFTFHFHVLEKEMAAHSSVLAWRIPGTEKPNGLLSMRSHRVGHNWSDLAATAAAYTHIHVHVHTHHTYMGVYVFANILTNIFLSNMYVGIWFMSFLFMSLNVKSYFLKVKLEIIKNAEQY